MVEHDPCAGAIVLDEAGRLLLIRRGRPPARGSWTIPGGRCEPGESAADACVREVAEETGLNVEILRLAGRVELDGPTGRVYDVEDFVCSVVGGSLRAGDDADDARWVQRDELDGLDIVPDLLATLRRWDVFPT
jgi:8-oxo-dGTP diphosphatase